MILDKMMVIIDFEMMVTRHGGRRLNVFLWTVIHGNFRDNGGGEIKHGFAVHGGDDAISLIEFSDDGMAQLPVIENGLHGFLVGGVNGKEHTLLAFRQHNVVGCEMRHP